MFIIHLYFFGELLLYRFCNFSHWTLKTEDFKIIFKGPFSDKICFAITVRLVYHTTTFLCTQEVLFSSFHLDWGDMTARSSTVT